MTPQVITPACFFYFFFLGESNFMCVIIFSPSPSFKSHTLVGKPNHRPQSCTVALRERLCENPVTHYFFFFIVFGLFFFCVTVCVLVRASVCLCAGVSVSVCVCYSVLIWLCSQMTVPLYNMTLKCAKCGVISSADVSTTATSNAMLVPLIIFP